MVVDLTNKGVSGKDAEAALSCAGITVNKNTVPFEPRTPFDPSGIRIGTPALTTRGMKEPEMKIIAGWIDEIITHHNDEKKLSTIKNQVEKLASGFPLHQM